MRKSRFSEQRIIDLHRRFFDAQKRDAAREAVQNFKDGKVTSFSRMGSEHGL